MHSPAHVIMAWVKLQHLHFRKNKNTWKYKLLAAKRHIKLALGIKHAKNARYMARQAKTECGWSPTSDAHEVHHVGWPSSIKLITSI